MEREGESVTGGKFKVWKRKEEEEGYHHHTTAQNWREIAIVQSVPLFPFSHSLLLFLLPPPSYSQGVGEGEWEKGFFIK